MDAFEQIKKHLVWTEKKLEKKPNDGYLVGLRWGLTMALQIMDVGRWLEWHCEQIDEAERLDGR